MEYNNYYPVQSGHPPPPNQQHGGGPSMQQHQPPQPQQGGQIMHSPMPQQRNIRQTMQPGSQNHHQQQMQQMQSQQHIGHPQQQQQQQLPPQQQHQQQQHHPNYHQIQPHPHGQSVSHSSSPLAQQQQNQHHNHNHQPNLPGPPLSQQQQQSMSQHVHPQSPHHHGNPMHIQQQQHQQQQSLNQMARPQMEPSVMNHPQPVIHQPGGHLNQQSFFNAGGPPMAQANIHHFSQNHQTQYHPHHQPQQHQPQPPPPPPMMHHHAPPMSAHNPHMQQASVGRNSPYYPTILQTEFRIIELNRRLQCRPIPNHPYNPLPNPYDESIWWERFAADFFEDDATLTLKMHDDKPVEYIIGRTLIPRFFRSYFDGGVIDLAINLRNPKETSIHPHLITLDCDQAFIVTSNIFRHPSMATNQGVVVHNEGHLTLDFVSNNFDQLSIKSWRFYTRSSREFIDRSILNAMGPPNTYLAEPITRQGFTKSTITYLKMCMIMEPMQELMFQHKQTKLDPRSCLRKLLYDRYKFRSGEDSRTATNKRRKRKPSVAPAITGSAATNKKSKAGINNTIANIVGINNMMMSPSAGPPSFSLASQDVMVVGEPSMMGGDFGDDNERMITRLENTQYDPTASTPSNIEDSDNLNAHPGNEMSNSRDDVDGTNIENHNMSPMMAMQQAGPHHVDQQQLVSQKSIQQQQIHHVPHSSPNQNQLSTINHASSPQDRSIDQATDQLLDHQEETASRDKESTTATNLNEAVNNTDLETSDSGQTNLTDDHQELANHHQNQELDHHQQPTPHQQLHQQELLPSQPHLQSRESEKQQQQLQPQLQSHPQQHEPQLQNQQPQPQPQIQLSPQPQLQEQQQQQQPPPPSQQQQLEFQSTIQTLNGDEGQLIQQSQTNNQHEPECELGDSGQLCGIDKSIKEEVEPRHMAADGSNKLSSLSNSNTNTNMMNNIIRVDQTDNHADTMQLINEESLSNSQLPCSTANATTAMEQQQPVDNGVA